MVESADGPEGAEGAGRTLGFVEDGCVITITIRPRRAPSLRARAAATADGTGGVASATSVEASAVEEDRTLEGARNLLPRGQPVHVREGDIERRRCGRGAQGPLLQFDGCGRVVAVEDYQEIKITVAGVVSARDGAEKPDLYRPELCGKVSGEHARPVRQQFTVP